MADASNSLISSKSSDSGLHILLHPLVLLNISDHITRHTVRQQTGLIVGALLGQQKGRSISIEHVFDCNLTPIANGDFLLHQTFFEDRLKQLKDVHKSPALDLVGWFTVTPASGPLPTQLPVHEQILQNYNETAVLLAFHSSEVEDMSIASGKLPITIYESVYEGENTDDGDKTMQGDDQPPTSSLKFRSIPYSIETGEAEMIGLDSVATGGGNATAIKAHEAAKPAPDEHEKEKDRDKRQKLIEEPEDFSLSPEDEDLVASLSTRLSAVKILQSRIKLIKSYLQAASNSDPNIDPNIPKPVFSHSLLRNIACVISHLTLLNPHSSSDFSVESLAQANDVLLVSIFGALGKNVQQFIEIGDKYSAIEMIRRIGRPKDGPGGGRLGQDVYGEQTGMWD